MRKHACGGTSFFISAGVVVPARRCVNASDWQGSQHDPGEYGETPSSGALFDYSPAGYSQMSDGEDTKQVLSYAILLTIEDSTTISRKSSSRVLAAVVGLCLFFRSATTVEVYSGLSDLGRVPGDALAPCK